MDYVQVEPTAPDYRVLFKPLENAETEGCYMHIWSPKPASAQPVPVFYYIHGGAFTAGDAEHGPYPQFKYWLERGVAVVSVEYRFLPHVTNVACREDVLAGYLFVQTKLNNELETLGSELRVDGSRCIAAGASAGGTLCVNLGTDILRLDDPTVPRLKGVITAYPLVNPNMQMTGPRSAYYELEKSDPTLFETAQRAYDEPVCTGIPFAFPFDLTKPRWAWLKAALRESAKTFDTKSHNSFLFGCDAPYPESTDAAADITAASPPTFVLAAMGDEQIPVVNSFHLRDALVAAGVEVHVGEARDAPHGFSVMMGKTPDKGLIWWNEAVFPALEWAWAKVK